MSIWGHSGVFGVKQKISTNTYRMKPIGRIMGGKKGSYDILDQVFGMQYTEN